MNDLEALDEAVQALGGELRRGQTTYKWYGSYLGDSEEGRRAAAERGSASFGKSEHAIRLKPESGYVKGDYEVGVVKALNGEPGYDLMMDSFSTGQKLLRQFGPGFNRLRQEYAVAVSMRKHKAVLQRKGFAMVGRETLENGTVRLRMRKR